FHSEFFTLSLHDALPISDGLYKQCVPRDETLAVFPFGRWGTSMLWQAESGFWFRMAEGNIGRSSAFPPNFVSDPTVAELTKFGRSEEHTSELQSRGHLVC